MAGTSCLTERRRLGLRDDEEEEEEEDGWKREGDCMVKAGWCREETPWFEGLKVMPSSPPIKEYLLDDDPSVLLDYKAN